VYVHYLFFVSFQLALNSDRYQMLKAAVINNTKLMAEQAKQLERLVVPNNAQVAANGNTASSSSAGLNYAAVDIADTSSA
jgi:hypothetical protein